MEKIEKVIDIRSAFKKSNSKLLRSVPGFMVTILEKLICQDEMNATIHRSRDKEGIAFIKDVLEGWKVRVNIKGRENIPASGRFIFAGNHPVGGIDALAFYSMISDFFPDVMSPTNELLNLIPNMRPVMLGINVFGKNTRETASKIDGLFESDIQIMIFPSGEVSRKIKGVISDPVWQKTFITKAVKHRRDIIPVHITGRNSGLFYFVANLRKSLGIKMYIETILLPREMMKQRNSVVTVTVGQPISYRLFTNEKNHHGWAQEIRDAVYKMGAG
ncbi:MAG: glycerol acyltransferase [Bacteroidales bacterium]|nr:glycerol acyltransferase [Bacteroidales bacterium]